MTLVLSCLTHDYVIQVSDQRLTRITDGRLFDDLRNKGTMYCAEMAFAYSGLAEIDGTRSDRWLANILAKGANLDAALKTLVEQLSLSFGTIPLKSSEKRHAFVGVGFCRPWPGSPLYACQITVSNFLSAKGTWLSDAKPVFEIEGVLLHKNKPFAICRPVGAGVGKHVIQALVRQIRRRLKHKATPTTIMHLMAQAVRDVADIQPSVGKALLIQFIPRQAVEKSRIMFLTPIVPNLPPLTHSPMFFHMPSDSRHVYRDTPNFVCNGVVMSGSIESNWQSIQGPSPHPDTLVDQHTYLAFLRHSELIQSWSGFIRSLGASVGAPGMVSRDIDMMRLADITTFDQIEKLLRDSESWGRGMLSELLSTALTDGKTERKSSVAVNGFVTYFLVANHPDVFNAKLLLNAYQWGGAERFLSIAARHRPKE